MKHDVADFLMQLLAVAGDGDDDGVVVAAESRIANRHTDERAGIADDCLDETPLWPRRLEVEYVFRRWHQTANPLQFNDRIDDADEQQPISGSQLLPRRY